MGFKVLKDRCMLLTILEILSGITALKDMSVTIPSLARYRDTVTLQCHYDLEGEPLYTVKWYKGGKEFYRYIPKELPNTQVFPLPGIRVNLSKSSANVVVLEDVDLEVTGRYKCEVSSDAPNFYTTMQSGYMYVVDVPTEDPVITIEKDALGYTMKGNCSAPPSFPPANITWFLNGEKVNEFSEETQPIDRKIRRMPLVSSSVVKLEIDANTFRGGKAILTCMATVFDMYVRKKEVVLEEDRPQPRPSSVLGTLNPVSGAPIVVVNLIFIALLSASHVIFR